MGSAEKRRVEAWRLALLPLVLALIAVLWPVLHLGRYVLALRAWIGSLGPLAPVVYTMIDALLTPLVMPALALTVGAAGLFGPVVGLLVVLVASNTASVICFMLARYVARDTVVSLISGRPEFERIDRLVAERGAMAVALIRLIPLSPFEIVSYAFGLTGVPFRTYALWTAVGSFPGAVLYVVGSSTVFDTVATGRVPPGLLAIFAAVLAVVIVLAAYVGRELRR